MSDPHEDKAKEALNLGSMVAAGKLPGGPWKHFEVVRNARAVLASDPDVLAAVANALADLDRQRSGDTAPLKADYDARIKKLEHDRDYWQGRCRQATDDMREQAAGLAEKAGQPRLAGSIRGLRVDW